MSHPPALVSSGSNSKGQNGNGRPLWTISEDHTRDHEVQKRRMNACSQAQSALRTVPVHAAQDSPRNVTSIQRPLVLSEPLNLVESPAEARKAQVVNSNDLLPTQDAISSHAASDVKVSKTQWT